MNYLPLDPVLASLSLENAKVLDDIIAKASDATAFTTVFKAYSEVLRQKGLDPGEDVIYYKQLLKLGVVKGINWGAKWRIVRAQLPVASVPSTSVHSSQKTSSSVPSILLEPNDDVFLSKSNDNTIIANKVSAENIFNSSLETPSQSTSKHYRMRHKTTPSSVSSSINEAKSQIKRPLFVRSQPLTPLGFNTYAKYTSNTPKSILSIGDKETWKKVDETRLIQNSDYYRRQSLLLFHFQTWRRSMEWIRITYSQIDEARANIQLRIFYTRWRSVFLKIQRQVREAETIHYKRNLYLALQRWYKRLVKRRVRKFNDELDLKASNFLIKCRQRLCRDMWMRWYRLHFAGQLYLRHLSARAFKAWLNSLRSLDRLEILADQFEEEQDKRALRKLFDFWYRRSNWKGTEIYMEKIYSFRILKQSFECWLRQTRENKRTNDILKKNVSKRTFKMWQKAFLHKEGMVLRSDKYIHRCNTYLLRAVMRVWVARERGQMLSRIRDGRILETALTIWQHRLQEIHVMQERAVLSSKRTSTQSLKMSFANWNQKVQFLHAQKALANERYVCTLAYNVLLEWRLRLRELLSSFRAAKVVRRYFLLKSTWNRWRSSLDTARRKKKLRLLELEFVRKSFARWKTRYQTCKQERGLLEGYAQLTRKRILSKYTKIWTNKVISTKLREMDIADRCNKQLFSDAFNTWKAAHSRNLENLSLARSYLDVKREKTLRRTFAAWLTKACKTKADRLRKAEDEEEARLNILTAAWERWRDRFCENALREAELEVLIRNQRNILRHAFSSWLSHCDSIPGIRLYATNLKSKMWSKWREALPRAVQASKAQDVHIRRLLRHTFDRWKEAHRTKIALKAVTRARHLRLPGPGYRASLSDERDSPVMKPAIRRPLRSQLPITPTERAPGLIGLSSNAHKERQLRPFPTSLITASNSSAFHGSSREREAANNNNEYHVRTELWTRLRNAQVARHMK